jgi:hypothetical protein
MKILIAVFTVESALLLLLSLQTLWDKEHDFSTTADFKVFSSLISRQISVADGSADT